MNANSQTSAMEANASATDENDLHCSVFSSGPSLRNHKTKPQTLQQHIGKVQNIYLQMDHIVGSKQ